MLWDAAGRPAPLLSMRERKERDKTTSTATTTLLLLLLLGSEKKEAAAESPGDRPAAAPGRREQVQELGLLGLLLARHGAERSRPKTGWLCLLAR